MHSLRQGQAAHPERTFQRSVIFLRCFYPHENKCTRPELGCRGGCAPRWSSPALSRHGLRSPRLLLARRRPAHSHVPSRLALRSHCPLCPTPGPLQAMGAQSAVLPLWAGPLRFSRRFVPAAVPFDPPPCLSSLSSRHLLFLRIVCFSLPCSFFLIPISGALCFSSYFFYFYFLISSMLL